MNVKLNLKQCASLVALALAGTAALAADPSSATTQRTRADVVAETLAARAAGTLVPAGQAVEPRASVAITGPSRTRADVVAETLAARAAGTLVPAGEAVEPRSAMVVTGTPRARADVVSEVLAARAAGQLIPAGQGPDAPRY